MTRVGDLDVAVGRQGVHVDRVVGRERHAALVGDPVRVLLRDPRAVLVVLGLEHRAPALGVDDVGAAEAGVEVVQPLEAAARPSGVGLGLGHDVAHQLELGRMDELDVHAEARHRQDQVLGHADGLLVARGVGPADGQGAAAQARPSSR